MSFRLNRISLLKKLDAFVGPCLVRLFPQAPEVDLPLSKVKRVLFIRPGGIGDAVLLIPAIQALQQSYPQACIEVLAEKRNQGAFALCPEVENIFCYDEIRAWPRLFARKYDLIIDTEQWHYLSAFIARLLRGRCRCGFSTNARERLFARRVGYTNDDYEVQSFLHLLDALKIEHPTDVATPFLQVPVADQRKVNELLSSVKGRYVVLFPSASIGEKRWPVESFRILAAHSRRTGYEVVVVGGAQDRDVAEQILADGFGLNLAGELSLAQSTAVLQRCAVLVSGDSGVLHLGVGVGSKTVSLFGPGIISKWSPLGPQHRVVSLGLPCSPCTKFGTTPPCPYGAKCIKDIPVDAVWDAVQELLEISSAFMPKGR